MNKHHGKTKRAREPRIILVKETEFLLLCAVCNDMKWQEKAFYY